MTDGISIAHFDMDSDEIEVWHQNENRFDVFTKTIPDLSFPVAVFNVTETEYNPIEPDPIPDIKLFMKSPIDRRTKVFELLTVKMRFNSCVFFDLKYLRWYFTPFLTAALTSRNGVGQNLTDQKRWFQGLLPNNSKNLNICALIKSKIECLLLVRKPIIQVDFQIFQTTQHVTSQARGLRNTTANCFFFENYKVNFRRQRWEITKGGFKQLQDLEIDFDEGRCLGK